MHICVSVCFYNSLECVEEGSTRALLFMVDYDVFGDIL
jgi:hypothetical protein